MRSWERRGEGSGGAGGLENKVKMAGKFYYDNY